MPTATVHYAPTPTVTVDGSRPDGLANALAGVLVEETTDGLARCELRFTAWGTNGRTAGYRWLDRQVLDFGAEVAVTMGPPDEHGVVFTGRVTGLEGDFGSTGGPSLVVLAEDGLQDLRMTRRTRAFEESTDAEVIEAVARDHGLTPAVDLDGPTRRQVLQLNQSDLAFVRDRARPLGADVWLDGTTLRVGRPAADDPIVLRFGSELLRFRVLADLADQCTEQRVGGWDVAGKTEILETADDGAVRNQLGPGTGGGAVLQDAFGDRRATAVLAAATTTAEARALAKGLYLDRARRFVTGTGHCDGLPLLRCGRTVELQGVGALFDGPYELSRVAHRMTPGEGYRTEIDVQRGGVGS